MRRHPSTLRTLVLRAVLAVVFAAAGSPSFAQTQPDAQKPNTIRPEIAAPLKSANELSTAKKFPEALAKLREADAVAERTPYEIYVIERTRGVIAANAGDVPASLRSFEIMLGTGFVPAAEQLGIVEGLARSYFRMKDYPKASQWAARYFKEGGNNPQMRLLQVTAHYLGGDFATAAPELRAMVEADEKAGAKPAQDALQMLGNCYIKLNDAAGSVYVQEKLLLYYPTKEYWADAIRRVGTRPGFAESLTLDVLRLEEATGNFANAEQYVAMAQLALKAGYPAEAKRVVDQGFASGVLGSGPGAELQRQLRDTAAKQVAEDVRTLPQSAKDAGAAKDGRPLVNVGYAMVSAGQFDQGLALMEQGIQKGVGSRPEEARLHLGIAYLAAGEKAKAIAAFKAVQGGDGTADLARLWMIHAQRSAG